MAENRKKIAVIGVGNLLLGDEGVGIHAVNELKKMSFSSNVDIIDGGTMGIDLLFLIEDAEHAIIIDCLDSGEKPGTLFRVPAEEIFAGPGREKYSLHEMDLVDVLSTGRNLHMLPHVVIFGVQPGEISVSLELTPEVRNTLPRLLKLISAEINAFAGPAVTA
jgi:hydrogenase maturation protease